MEIFDDKFTVVGIGELLWDLLPEGKRLGGAPANFACHVTALGANGVPVSAVGSDELGEEALAQLDSASIDKTYIEKLEGLPTGTVDVKLDVGGKPEYLIKEDVAWDNIEWNEDFQALADKAHAVCFGTLAQRSEKSRETIGRFLSSTREECLRVFDVNLRQSYYSRELLEIGLIRCSVLKLNDEELPVIAELLELDCADEVELLTQLTENFHIRLAALTRGGNGSLIVGAEGISEHAGVKTFPVDTIGAGDSFTACLTVGLLEGMPLDKINDLANRVASFVCSQKGATPALPESLRIQ